MEDQAKFRHVLSPYPFCQVKLPNTKHTVINHTKNIVHTLDLKKEWSKGAIIFFGRGWVPNLQKVSLSKIATPLFRQQKFYDPPSPIHLTPKQAKIVLKSIFLNKINTLYLWSSCDSLHFGHQNFYDPPIFLYKNL